MKKISNLLYKIFSVTLAFFYQIGHANAGTFDPADFCTNDTGEMKELCPEGEYLARCGRNPRYTIGANWLRGMAYVDDTGSNTSSAVNYTPDYFNYYTDSNMAHLSSFFKGESFRYQKTASGSLISASASNISKNRNRILNTFCTQLGDIYYDDYECEPCPNGGMVEKSTVNVVSNNNNNDNGYIGKVVCGSWNVHPISDCYVKEFQDSTGTYSYYYNDGSEAQKCIYTENITGNRLDSSIEAEQRYKRYIEQNNSGN